MVLTSDGKKIIGYSKGTNSANSGFIGTGDAGGTLGVLEGTNAAEVAFNGRGLNTFTFSKPTNAAFNTLVQSHVVHTDRVDPAVGPTHPYKCTCFNNSNSTLYTRNTPGNFYIGSNIAYMVRGNRSADKMNAMNIFIPGILNNASNVQDAFNNALMPDWTYDTYDCKNLQNMFVRCDFNNKNIIFNTVNGGLFLMHCTNVNTCRVRQYGGNSLPVIFNSSINVVDFFCNVNGGVNRFMSVKANVFNLSANIFNYRLTFSGLIANSQFVASNINLNFSNSPMNVVIYNTPCNANINNATVNYFCQTSSGNFNITNSKANGAFISSTGAINANLSNCTVLVTTINGNINNSRINYNTCDHRETITQVGTVNNVIINDYNSTCSAPQISHCTATNTKCYWNRCNSLGFFNVDNSSTEQHWESSYVQYSLRYSNNSIHTVFFNNVSFGGNAICVLNNSNVNCNIIGSNSSAYYTLLNCNNSVVNLNQNGNAGYPAGYCNNIKLNYHFNAPSSDTRTSSIQYVYNSNILAHCELNTCNHTLPFATECRNTVIELHDYNRSSSVSRIVLTNSSNSNLKYYCGTPGRIYGVENSTIYGELILNDCNNVSGTIVTEYQDVNIQNVTNSNIILSPYYSIYYATNTQIGYCNNVMINYKQYYNAVPVNYNTCSNMYLTTYSGNSVNLAPNNTRFDLYNVSLHNKMIVSNRCVALQGPNIFVQTVTTPGTNTTSTIYNLVSDTLIGGSLTNNATYMAGTYKAMNPSNNVRCIGMINNLRILGYPYFVTNSAMRVNTTYGTGLTFINNSYYATNRFDTLNAAQLIINDCAFIVRDTSLWMLNVASYVNNSVCVLGGQSTKWNTNRTIQFDNCLVIAVKWNRATYGNIRFNNCVLVSSSAFGTLANNSIRVTSLAQAVVNTKYNYCMPSKFRMPIEGFKMLTGVADVPDSSDISI